MPQQHLDRLTPIDASFLHQEGPTSHMHVGGLLVFGGSPPPFQDLLDHIRGRLHLVPRYRQKLAIPPLESGRPLWVDDPNFNLEFHVRNTALPAPGTEEQLLALVGRISSQPLDRTKPLWEMWMVEGLHGPDGDGTLGRERFALIQKTHHSLVDGISGVDLATVLFDLSPTPPPPPADLEPWRPQPEPTPAELVLAGIRDTLTVAGSAVVKGIAASLDPARSLGAARDALQGLGEIVWAGLNPAPDTPLNVEIGPHRRFAVVRQELADYKKIKNALGGTVNDVVLTVVSGALAGWLRSRSVNTEGLELRALVPVSVRTAEQHNTLGNQLTVMRGPLPVYIDDPVARLAVVRNAMNGLKESKQAVGASTLTAAQTLAPPTILAQASRLNFSTRLFNLLVTNIPGPQVPLYVLGHKLEEAFPIAFLPQHHALAIAIMSYDGAMDYGLLGDFDALSDIELVAEGIDHALAELLEAAGGVARGPAPAANAVRAVRKSPANGAPAKAAPAMAAPAKAPPAKAGPARDAPAKNTPAKNTPAKDAPARGARKPAAATSSESTNGTPPTPILPTGRRRTVGGPASDMRAKRNRGGRSAPRRPPA